MGRVADSTIKGFMYQFNLSLNEILKSDDEAIMLEGIIEDIDKIGSSEVTAIQCKYHESVDVFKWSIVYKPILQMLKTYTNGSVSNIHFVLYAFFPGEKKGKKEITVDKIEEMLNTYNSDYICDYVAYIKKPQNQEIEELVKKQRKSKDDKAKIVEYYRTNQLDISCDLEEFVSNRFTFCIGSSYNELTEENKELLGQMGFEAKDIEDLVYPNAIQKIATLSMLKDDEARNITKEEILSELKMLKKTAITRWTKELANFKEILTRRRKQMSESLNCNYRKRCLIFKPENIENFDNEIVVFISNYVSKYCSKTKLHIPAIVCILGYRKENIDDIVARLYNKGIEVETGYRGAEFYVDAFNRNPQRNMQKSWMEFRIKICGDQCECINAINCNKQDDILQFTDELPEKLSVQDVNVELLNVQNFNQIEYLLKLKDEVEI